MDRIRDIVATAKEAAKLQETTYGEKVRKIEEEIAALEAELHQAVTIKREFGLISKLGEEGTKEAWEQLPERRKYEKEVLLAVFSSQDIPEDLNEENWATNAPEELKEDREILIARASATKFPIGDDRWLKNPCFSIPEHLLGDLEVLRAVAKPCPRALQHPSIPLAIYDDEKVFRAFVDREYTYPNDYRIGLQAVLERFSWFIRSNAEFMLQAATIGLNVFPHIAGGLRNDKGFCLKLAEVSNFNIPSDGLAYFSDSLKSDREVVLSLVQWNGCVLKDAAPSHRQDLEIVCAASEKEPAALVFCNGLVRKRLVHDKEFMKYIMSRRWFSSDHCPGLYAMLSADLKLDLEMIVVARKGNCLDVSDLPMELWKNAQFWKDVLGKSSLFWRDLPDVYKLDISFARCITGFVDADTVLDVVKVHPELSSDAEFWCGVILSSTSDGMPEEDIIHLIHEIGSGVLNNRAVMLLACAQTDELLSELSRDFMLDRDFVEATVHNSYYAIYGFPFEAQLLYPDLVAIAISKFGDDLSECIELVNPELWSNLVVAEAWFREGGPLHDDIPVRLKEDPDYCLLIAEHCSLEEAKEFVSPDLKSSKDFMLSVIKKNPSAYLLAHDGVEMDYEVTLAAFGSADSDGLVDHMNNLISVRAYAHLQSFLHEAQRKLRAHDGLFNLLFGMSAFSGIECQLTKLQQGQETTLVLKRRIAEYVGSPIGSEVVQLRRAVAALHFLPEREVDRIESMPAIFRMMIEMAMDDLTFPMRAI